MAKLWRCDGVIDRLHYMTRNEADYMGCGSLATTALVSYYRKDWYQCRSIILAERRKQAEDEYSTQKNTFAIIVIRSRNMLSFYYTMGTDSIYHKKTTMQEWGKERRQEDRL
jgi:hypothetical protein